MTGNKLRITAITLLVFTVLATLPLANSAQATEIRFITPPKLNSENLGKKLIGYRPMRRGAPNLSVEQIGNKTVANNYGHGGSGWTLAPGSSKHVISNLLKQFGPHTKAEPIAVIGAGALGLFSAIELYKQGFTNITVIADQYENLTSHVAGGLLAPVSMDNDPQMQKLIDGIGIDAYRFYHAIATGTHATFKVGAKIVPAYFPTREESGLEPYVGKVMNPAKDVVVDFGTGVTREMVVYDDGIFMDTGALMNEMRAYLEGKIHFKQARIQDFSEIESKIIVNCSGLGSKDLNGDSDLVPVQGHLIMLRDQNPEDLQHMMLAYFGKDKTKSGLDVKRSYYLFPKTLPGAAENDIGVIGGTFVEGADANTLNEEEFEILVQGARDFYGLTQSPAL